MVTKAAKSNQISQITENCGSPLNISPFYYLKEEGGKQKQTRKKRSCCNTGNNIFTHLIGWLGLVFLSHFLFNPNNPTNQHFLKGNYFKWTTLLIAWISPTLPPKL